MASELLGKWGMLWSNVSAGIEYFQMNFITTIYGDGAMAAVKAECWTVVLTMVCVIWCDMRRVGVELEMAYGSDTPYVMVF